MASNSDDSLATLSTKKRPALADVTNLKNASRSGVRTSVGSSKPLVPCVAKIAKTKNGPTEHSSYVFPASPSSDSTSFVSSNNAFRGAFERSPRYNALPSLSIDDAVSLAPSILVDSPRRNDVSTTRQICVSAPLDERSSCYLLRSGELGHIEDSEVQAIIDAESNRRDRFSISDNRKKSGNMSKIDALLDEETIDQDVELEQGISALFHPTTASDIYKHLRVSETINRPSVDFMERIQIDISASMRATLIDWLVEVAEEYRLRADTLFLTVNYIDRYLSGKVMRRQRLQLLGVACMMIAAKYEEICPPHVEEFCYITDNTYLKEEILQMESAVLNYLKFEMAAPTAISFLRRFISAAQQTSEVLSIQLECMANYITELSLLDYVLLRYPPSLVAASATFLANYLLSPYNRPWNSKLVSCTCYQPSDLCECVKLLLHLCRCGGGRNLPAIRNKYSHHKFKYVAKKYCPLSIPPEFFEDVSS